jgi:hypothetical protein
MHNSSNNKKTLEELFNELYHINKPTNERLIEILNEVKTFEQSKEPNDRALQVGTFPALKAGVLDKLAKDPKTSSEVLDRVYMEAQTIEIARTKDTLLKSIAANPNCSALVLGSMYVAAQGRTFATGTKENTLSSIKANPNAPQVLQGDKKIPEKKTSFLEKLKSSLIVRGRSK